MTIKQPFYKALNTSFLKMNLQHFADEEDQVSNEGADEGQGGDSKSVEENLITLTEEELQEKLQREADRRVSEAIKKREEKLRKEMEERIEKERQEAEELAKLSAEERAKVEREREMMKFEEEKKKLEDEKRKFNQEKLFLQTEKVLSDEKLPTEFASFVMGEDAEKTHENIQVFKEKFQEAVKHQVNEVLKGRAPRTGGSQRMSELEQLEQERQEAIKNKDMARAIAIKNKIFELSNQ